MLCSDGIDMKRVVVQLFARKKMGQFAPDQVGQFNWMVHWWHDIFIIVG